MSKEPSLKRSIVYPIIALPFLLASLGAVEYGSGLYIYLVPVLLVIIQLFRPTKLVWWILCALTAGVAIMYSYVFIKGLLSKDPDEPSFLLFLAVIFWSFTFGLLSVGPEKIRSKFGRSK